MVERGCGVLEIIKDIVCGLFVDVFSKMFSGREKNKEEQKKTYNERPEFDIVKCKAIDLSKKNNRKVREISVFVAPIKNVLFVDDSPKVLYEKQLFDKKNWRGKRYILQNNGKTDITCVHIVSNSMKKISVFNKNILNNGVVDYLNYMETYDDSKIRVGEKFVINVFWHKNYCIESALCALLSIVLEDDNGRLWYQPLWVPNRKIYESRRLKKEDFKYMYDLDIAIKCFMNPSLW